MSETITPFELTGSASLLQLNARKEGPEDHKVLATDLKLRIVTSNEILLAFDPLLRVSLYDKLGEPRFARMGTVSWDQEFTNMALEIDGLRADRVLKFGAVKVRKFTFEPRKAGQVDLVFQATLKPDKGELDVLGQVLLADSARIRIFALQGDMFSTTAAAPAAAAPANAASQGIPPGEASALAVPPPRPADAAPAAPPAAEPAPTAEAGENSVMAVNGAGIPLGFRLDKRQHPAGTTFEDGGIVYDVTGMGEKTITLRARDPAPAVSPPPPPLAELTEEIKGKVKAAGQVEAAKHEDDRDFEAGFTRACLDIGLSKADVDEFYGELQSVYTEGWETVPEASA